MEMPIRILIVDGKLICGGVESFLMNIYRRIDRTKIQFDFLVHYEERFFYDDEVESLGGRIYRLSVREDNNFIKYKKDLKQFFLSHPEYHIVWGHMDGLASVYLKVAKACGVKLTIAHSHITSAERSLKGLIKRILRGGITRHADKCFACSTEAGQYLYGKHPFSLVPNAIDVDRFRFSPDARASIRATHGWEDASVIGHIGRFNDQKNHRYLIDIFKAYAANNPSARLCLCGDGENKPAIEAYVNECGLSDKVTFTGNIPNVDMYYSAFDLFILPSLYEGLPVSGIEAQTAGLGCVFADTITRETAILPNTSRFVSITRDPAAWCEDIDALLPVSAGDRESAHKAVGETGYNIHTLVKGLEEFFLAQY